MPTAAHLDSTPPDQHPENRRPVVSGDAAVAVASLHAMASGTLADFEALYTPDAVNREAVDEPPDTRGKGPAALYATALWLRAAFSDLAWRVDEVVQDRDLVVVHGTMSGRQTGAFVAHRADGTVEVAFPARGRRFAVTQTHWFRMSDGLVAEHWANRDDLGMGRQLGWNPPTPVYLVRMLLATSRARSRR
jgi:predicted ester cyclase